MICLFYQAQAYYLLTLELFRYRLILFQANNNTFNNVKQENVSSTANNSLKRGLPNDTKKENLNEETELTLLGNLTSSVAEKYKKRKKYAIVKTEKQKAAELEQERVSFYLYIHILIN